MRKISLFLFVGILLLLIVSCKKEIISNAEVKEVITTEERECRELGQNIVKECRAVTPSCFTLKEQWDSKGCETK